MCSLWLEKSFKIKSKIVGIRVLTQMEIDKKLSLIGVEFDFISKADWKATAQCSLIPSI
jgi:hypothetical protein